MKTKRSRLRDFNKFSELGFFSSGANSLPADGGENKGFAQRLRLEGWVWGKILLPHRGETKFSGRSIILNKHLTRLTGIL